jgi:hypothetical protein
MKQLSMFPKPRKVKRLHVAGEWITGAEYVPSCEQCNIPPWEECDCSFPDLDPAEPLYPPPEIRAAIVAWAKK